MRVPLARQRRERILAQKLKSMEAEIALLRAGYEVDEERLAEESTVEEGTELRALDSAELNYRRKIFRGNEKVNNGRERTGK
jgi:hypothetical protein